MKTPSEFELIKQYFSALTPSRDDVLLGIGDDCALLQTPTGKAVAVSIDTLVSGQHFEPNTSAYDLGHKSLAVGLSDLAAMGAEPAWFTLALTLPGVDVEWLQDFSRGLAALAGEHGIQLVGGDTTSGPLTISIQVHGFTDVEHTLKRSGAQSGDMIYVTGTLGDAGAALALAKGDAKLAAALNLADRDYLQQRLNKPTPRVDFGEQLAGLATAAIDISDGLLADLGHILEASGKDNKSLGARIDLARLPLSAALQKLPIEKAQQFALSAGDDYELCFTASPAEFGCLQADFADRCTRIGIVDSQAGIYRIDDKGKLVTITTEKAGYEHFTSS